MNRESAKPFQARFFIDSFCIAFALRPTSKQAIKAATRLAFRWLDDLAMPKSLQGEGGISEDGEQGDVDDWKDSDHIIRLREGPLAAPPHVYGGAALPFGAGDRRVGMQARGARSADDYGDDGADVLMDISREAAQYDIGELAPYDIAADPQLPSHASPEAAVAPGGSAASGGCSRRQVSYPFRASQHRFVWE